MELRNGPEVKIDIYDDAIWTPERFRSVSGSHRITGGVPGSPGRFMGLMGQEACPFLWPPILGMERGDS